MFKLALISLVKDKEHTPVNLVYLATYLKKHLDIDIKIIDSNFDNVPLKLSIYQPDIIGISAMTVHYQTAKKTASLIKKYTKIPIILGGVHISTCPESLTKDFDIAIVGEAEKTLLNLINLYMKKKEFRTEELKKIHNLIFFEEDKLLKTEKLSLSEDIDEFPIPDRKFLNPKYFEPKVYNDIASNKEFIRTELITSRGCPYKCIFCSTSHFWERVRFHSPERVVMEMLYLNKHFNVNLFQILDDLFAFDKKRLLRIKELLEKNGLLNKVYLFTQIRGNVVDDELLSILKSMNVISVNIGLESGSDKVLQTLKGKGITVEQIKEAVVLSKNKGFDVRGSFMIASPGETLEDMKKTINLMEELKEIGINDCWCGVTTPLPQTQLWEIAKSKGLDQKTIDWDTLNPGLPFNPYFLEQSVPFKEFIKIFKKAKNISIEIAKQNSNYKENKFKRYIKNKVFFNEKLNKSILESKRKKRNEKLEQDFKNYFSST